MNRNCKNGEGRQFDILALKTNLMTSQYLLPFQKYDWTEQKKHIIWFPKSSLGSFCPLAPLPNTRNTHMSKIIISHFVVCVCSKLPTSHQWKETNWNDRKKKVLGYKKREVNGEKITQQEASHFVLLTQRFRFLVAKGIRGEKRVAFTWTEKPRTVFSRYFSSVSYLYTVSYFFTLHYIKNQQDANLAVLFISHCKITLHVSDTSASIIRSTKNCSSRHWCMSWVGMMYIQQGRPKLVAYCNMS